MEIKFDETGNVIVPESQLRVKENIDKIEELARKEGRIVVFELISEDEGCEWKIKLPEEISGRVLVDVKKWTDNKIPNQCAWLDKIDSKIYSLNIKKYKDRCTWCGSFRTALKTTLYKDSHIIVLKNKCGYER